MVNEENTFRNRDIIVTYEPKKCIHAGSCCAGLSEVFKTSVIPWIDLEGAPADRIIEQVHKCPSGALSYQRVGELVTVK
ncbi:MAG: (4Fe-4S)-binding protein [Flavobacteriaceae bacterium]|nr:(4Fe-4S)-binding protein [Flavobacteriaceae bacterium]